MKKNIIAGIMVLLAMAASAHELVGVTAEGDTLYFNNASSSYGKNALEVTYKDGWYGAVADEYTDTVVIPNDIVIDGKKYTVVGIGEQAFAECFKLLSITIPESIKYIKSGAFQSCCRIHTINYNAVRCADLTLPSFAPFSFGNMAYSEYVYDEDGYPERFWSAYDLREVNIGASVERIPDYMFYGMGGGLQQADLTKRPYDIVNSKEGVAHINFLGAPKEFGNQAFRACRVLEDITLPDGVTFIGQALLANCDTLMSVTLPNGIDEIPAYFFSGCGELSTVNFPASVKRVNFESFKNCAKLTSVSLPEGLTVVGPSAFRQCENLTTVVLPSTLTTIDGYAFSDCTSLTGITIPDAVSEIGNYAFEDCTNLSTVTLGEQTQLIGNFVFAGCLKLSEGEVNAPSRMPKIQADTFEGVKNSMKVNVPEESEEQYRQDEYWKRFFMPAGVEQLNSDRSANLKKYVAAGQVLIENDGQVYNVKGQQVEK